MTKSLQLILYTIHYFSVRYSFQIQHLNLKKPLLDVCTRWNSTYVMLKGLLEYKDYCNNNVGILSLSEEEWKKIHDIVEALGPVYAATIKLQGSQLLLGDFYKLWIQLKIEVEQINSSAAKNLLNCLKVRERLILNNDIVNAAVFLDPRLKLLLSVEEKAAAKKHLKNIAKRMLLLHQVCNQRVASSLIIFVDNFFIKLIPFTEGENNGGK